MAGKRSLFNISIDFSDEDLNQLFESFDPLMNENPQLEQNPDLKKLTQFDPIDWGYLTSVRDNLLSGIVDHYFRAEIYGLEKINKEGPAIIGCNHSGTAFPHDAVVLDALLWRYYKFMPKYKFRSVYSPKLAKVWWMRPYGVDNFWRKCGGIDMTFQNFSQLLENGERVIYYPEGVPGIGKGFTRRYQLQHFYSSFAVLAAMHDAPFYPILCVNGEWVNPTSITFPILDKLFDKLMGLPFFPVPAVFVGFIFPFFYFLSFPCNMKFFVGSPVNVRELLKKNGIEDYTKAEKLDYQKVADQVRDQMQIELTDAVNEHGNKPYNWATLKQKMGEIKGIANKMKATPFGWPFAYIKHERDLHRPKAGKIWSFLRDWDIWLFFFPFGWFLLAMTRALRKAPYGYRGMSKKEWRTKTGSYFWKLSDNPMQSRSERFGV